MVKGSVDDILLWPLTSLWGGVPDMPDACGLPCEYGNALKMPASLMHLFEELLIAHYHKEGKLMPGLGEGAGLYCGQFH